MVESSFTTVSRWGSRGDEGDEGDVACFCYVPYRTLRESVGVASRSEACRKQMLREPAG
ncbi:hypothetical protein [Anabaena azotica]|uniref:CpcA n=1 Tax=Anabaena azotica FACHB-119 TaxID=947527 RepID=A0ABR8D3S8_9NOST|nr:hypothetical protein [Anabaena azotica]MBD2501827.1 hypothetical protein [Anabaena azotica FACHB-119]